MHIQDFKMLLLKEQPCHSGLAWFEVWESKNPDGNTTQFFKWAASKAGVKASAKSIALTVGNSLR